MKTPTQKAYGAGYDAAKRASKPTRKWMTSRHRATYLRGYMDGLRERKGKRKIARKRVRRKNPAHPIVLTLSKSGRTLYYDGVAKKFTAHRSRAKHFKTARHAALVGRLMLARHGATLRPYKMAVVGLT
jgi:hypothetical protein